jgi:hypothetical protein
MIPSGGAHPDLAEALQARLRANRDAETAAEDKRLRVEGLEAQVVTPGCVAVAEALSKQRQDEAEAAVKRVRALKAPSLREAAVAEAEAPSRQLQQRLQRRSSA